MSVIDANAVDSPGRALSGAEKAAIVLLELGTDRSAEVLKLLGDQEVTEISSIIARSGTIQANDAERSMREFAALVRSGQSPTMGGLANARKMLEASVGPERASAILDGLVAEAAPSPFEFLSRVEPRQVVNFLANEHPQTVAVVVANLPAEAAAQLVAGLSEEMQREASVRLAQLERISSHVVAEIVNVLERRFGSGMSERRETDTADGVQRLIDILNRSDRNTEKSIFEALESFETELALTVRSRMFLFEDILDLDDRSVQLILRNVDNSVLATALKGVKPEVRDKVSGNMSERAATNLIDEIDMLGQVRLADVQEAQGVVVQAIRTLEEAGDIVISRGTEEFVE
ncbi:MAG: flagellar motor switch protein FliG [Ilumatobacter sp.]